jgi:hypothetical protein
MEHDGMTPSPQAAIAARHLERATAAGFDPATIPDGYEVSDLGMCRSCRAPILWLLTPKGHRMPWSLAGVSHFADCPTAAEHRRPR